MQVKSSRLGVATYLVPDGPVVGEALPVLEATVAETRTAGAVEIVIDLRQVAALDSRALEYLLDLSTELRQQGGSVRLAHPTAVVKEVLAITGLDATIPVFADIESAGRSFL